MKTKTIFSLCILLAIGLISNAQTLHTTFDWSADGSTDPCNGNPVSGNVTYQISYHLNPTTGGLENVHWIILHSDVQDALTGNKYIVSEVGHDNKGEYWSWPGVPEPVAYPEEGVMIEAHLKWVGKGGYKFNWIERLMVHRNAEGDVKVDKYSFSAECKE